MIITQCKINHLVNPVGYDFLAPSVSFVVSGARGRHQKAARIQVSGREDFSELLFDSGVSEKICSTGYELPIRLQGMTRYYWKVWAVDETGDEAESEVQFFETAKTVSWEKTGWQAKWITPDLEKDVQAVVYTDLEIRKPVRKARIYMTGLGLYELYLNGEKQGEECLMPGFCDYDSWIQYQTYEPVFREGTNRLEIVLGDGWYKGWYGLRQTKENYGDRLAALAEIHLWYEDGSYEVIGSDESWKARKSRVVYSGIYPGEIYDATLDVSESFGVLPIDLGFERLSPRLSPPLTIHEHVKPVELITSPKGETILDLGQNMVGWIAFKSSAPAGTKIHLQMGELLQDGCFYNENLRTAKAEYTYISDGQERWVRQYFTFYGFRFVKVEGWPGEVRKDDFEGLVIHSEMEQRGFIQTSDELVNKLVHNSRWGMKGNFVDVPTDCPQRDERYGWTGDAQIFSGTASFFADTYAFYTKYGRDIYEEQKKLNGSVPDVVPVANYPGDASTAWADAATIIPWNVYLHSGNRDILVRQYPSMKAWVDYMKAEDDADGAKRLWLSGSHYADWLALDGSFDGGVYGATDPGYVASAYYFYSTGIVARSAKVLGKEEDARFYAELASQIKEAFIREFFSPNGRLAVDTMTAHVLALYMGLYPEGGEERLRQGLLNRLQKNFYHLDTGFVGTPYLCRVLSENGMNDLAYHLLLEKGYPGWLYEVLMGATTIWERWNSVMPDGKVSGTAMNSMNHYSYGSIVEWMFRDMAGINPMESDPGFKRFLLAPHPNYQMESARAELHSASGLIVSEWRIKDGRCSFHLEVPFDTTACLSLPVCAGELPEGMKALGLTLTKEGICGELSAGSYDFEYVPALGMRRVFSLDSAWADICASPAAKAVCRKFYRDRMDRIPFEAELCTLREITWAPFTALGAKERQELDEELRRIED